jgi:hypothetical protein
MPAIWFKPEDRVHPDWFKPLEELARRAADDSSLPPVNPDHFLYAARIERNGFAVLHSYRHLGSRKYLNVDDEGTTWRYTSSDRVGDERYAQFDDLAGALVAAELFRGDLLLRHLRTLADPTAVVPRSRAVARPAPSVRPPDPYDIHVVDGDADADIDAPEADVDAVSATVGATSEAGHPVAV